MKPSIFIERAWEAAEHIRLIPLPLCVLDLRNGGLLRTERPFDFSGDVL